MKFPRYVSGIRVLLAAVLAAVASSPAAAQYTVAVEGSEALVFERDELLAMHRLSEELRTDLEEDPRVLYYLTFGSEASGDPEPIWPWNSIEVVNDSVVGVVTPGNLREADRAYANYAVLRMRAVRADPDVPCAELFEREIEAVSGFVDGWIVARTLFGGPAYGPLDRLAAAREAGVLEGLIAARQDPQVGGCLAEWAEANPSRLEAFRTWSGEASAEAADPSL